jgi:hypothetical protein
VQRALPRFVGIVPVDDARSFKAFASLDAEILELLTTTHGVANHR